MKEDDHGLTIQPLPLLTKETDDWEAGGDFHGDDPNHLCGSWARDSVSMEGMEPSETKNLSLI